MVQMKDMQRLTRVVNSLILGFVVLMAGFFAHYHVTYMVYHSIPTIAMYLWFYYLIHKERMDLYVLMVYIEITIYMIAATICLGYNYGFHLYCMSLVSLSFYMNYLGQKLHTRRANPMIMSGLVICAYLFSTGYSVLNGPVYTINEKIAFVFMNANAISVFMCLLGYGYLIHQMVFATEDQLSHMALTDRLTGLFNRHYMITHLEELRQNITPDQWIAIADIDNFKNINDTYGHNCGDYVLVKLCEILREVCGECAVARWGGEEFLISSNGHSIDASILEKLRESVERTEFVYQGQEIAVTVTVGTSRYQEDQTLDAWIQSADDKLYKGKTGGKNLIVY